MRELTRLQKMSMEVINDFEPITKWDERRKQIAIDRLNRDIERNDIGNNDSGLYGKITEILSHDCYSSAKDVKARHLIDTRPIVDGKRANAEHKSNGGRIEHLYRIKDKDNSYVIYLLDFVPPARTKKDGTVVLGVRRYAYKIIKVSTFLEMIERIGCIKIVEHKDLFTSDKERAIQCSSKKLYLELVNGGYTDFDPNKTYSSKNIK